MNEQTQPTDTAATIRARAWGDAYSAINPPVWTHDREPPQRDTDGTVIYADVLRAFRAFMDTEYRPPLWAFASAAN